MLYNKLQGSVNDQQPLVNICRFVLPISLEFFLFNENIQPLGRNRKFQPMNPKLKLVRFSFVNNGLQISVMDYMCIFSILHYPNDLLILLFYNH